MDTEIQREKRREVQRRFRARQKERGVKRVLSEAEKAWQRNYMRERRAVAATSGLELAADSWWRRNPDKHRNRIKRWRGENLEYKRGIDRRLQKKRRSTPWGAINNRIWSVMHGSVRRDSSRTSKYTNALGYLWSDLRAHLEKQFLPEMNWKNWGTVWHLDHINPVSNFKYKSLDDPLFRQAWALSNLRPLAAFDNMTKGSK